MHALNITSQQDLVCVPIYTEKGKNVMRFKVHCLIFLFILSEILPCNIMGMKPVLRVNIRFCYMTAI